jgi:hypothetical protein
LSPYIGPSEAQSTAEAARPAVYRDLREQPIWFREEWQLALPNKLHRGATHVDDGDHLGGPGWTDRFRRYIAEVPNDPMRRAIAEMTKGSLLERSAARYLFTMACLDFDVVKAGLLSRPPITPEYSSYYADKAIHRLRERMAMLDRPRRSHRPCAEAGCEHRSDRLYCAEHTRQVA